MELEKSGRTIRRPGTVETQITVKNVSMQEKILSWLYLTLPGRVLLRPMISPFFSRFGGAFLSTRLSALLVKPFIRWNRIDLSGCEKKEFSSFNDFFTRKMRRDKIETAQDCVVAPCDGRLSVYPITETGTFLVKHTRYGLKELLKNEKLAKRYMGGTLWMYRLCVDDYHRYIYPVDGVKSGNVFIPGVFHTVNPIANDIYPIYKENTREYCLIRTQKAGTILQMEVGAMLVGRIDNLHSERKMVKRGEEKGWFSFGGSTIIVLTEKDKGIPDEEIRNATLQEMEYQVKLGLKVGTL